MEQNPFKNSSSFFSGLIPLKWYTLQEELQCENCHTFFCTLFFIEVYIVDLQCCTSLYCTAKWLMHINMFFFIFFSLLQDIDYSSQLFISCVNKLEAKCQLSHVKISQRQVSSKLSFRFMINYLWGRHPEDDEAKKKGSQSYR